MEQVLALDFHLFHLINQHWTNGWLDQLMPCFREKLFWAPLYLFLLSFVWINYGTRVWPFVLAVIVTLALADTASSQWVKKSVKRPRPCHLWQESEDIRLLTHCGAGYSFTSSHASNHFALAVFLGLTLGRRIRWLMGGLLLWAAMIAYAQVYVGLHFPLDVLAGALLGSMIALLVARVYLSWSQMDFLQLNN
ncbi:MAG: phosphatase PAP2 family protein [Bacteroidota bacterium]